MRYPFCVRASIPKVEATILFEYIPTTPNTVLRVKFMCAKFSPCSRSLQRHFQFALTLTATLLLTSLPTRANAANGIFSGAQSAMTCIITSASSGGGATNTIITSLPAVIFTAIALFLFAYFLGSTFQLVQAIRAGEEASQLLIPILSAMIGVIIMILFQNILFGSGAC